MATTSVTVRMDKDLKKDTEEMLSYMGLNMTTAITLFAKAVVNQGKIPFEIATDPFYSVSNQKRLKEAAADLKAGKNIVVKTIEELEAMEDE